MPPVNRSRALAETVHLAALGIWFGAIGMTGAAAAVAFPTMRDLDPTLGAYAAFPKEHWPIAAGEVLFKLFQISDLVSILCVVLAVGSLGAAIVAGGLSMGRLATKLRVLLLVLIIAVQSWALFVLMPRMTHNVNEFWDAAKAGEVQRAGEYRVRFSDDHPTSRRVSEILLLTIAASLVATGVSMTDRKPTKKDPES